MDNLTSEKILEWLNTYQFKEPRPTKIFGNYSTLQILTSLLPEHNVNIGNNFSNDWSYECLQPLNSIPLYEDNTIPNNYIKIYNQHDKPYKIFPQLEWKIDTNKLNNLEQYNKFKGYKSNNDRRQHGKKPLRLKQIEMCKKKFTQFDNNNIYNIFNKNIKDIFGDLENKLFYDSLYKPQYPNIKFTTIS
jgi:hypothetical protein